MTNSEIAPMAGHGARIAGAQDSQWAQHNFRAMNTAVHALCFGADAATVAAVPADGATELSAADREDDELLRSVDSVLSNEESYEVLLPEVMR